MQDHTGKTGVAIDHTQGNSGSSPLQSILVGAVVGGVLGIVVVCLLVVIVLFVVRQRSFKRRERRLSLNNNGRNFNTAIYDESELMHSHFTCYLINLPNKFMHLVI